MNLCRMNTDHIFTEYDSVLPDHRSDKRILPWYDSEAVLIRQDIQSEYNTLSAN